MSKSDLLLQMRNLAGVLAGTDVQTMMAAASRIGISLKVNWNSSKCLSKNSYSTVDFPPRCVAKIAFT